MAKVRRVKKELPWNASTVNLTIDPSGRSLGWATWPCTTWRELVPPDDCGILTAPAALEYHDACSSIIGQLNDILASIDFNVYTIFCEEPQFFQSGRGQTAARTGDVFRLAHMCGRLHQCALDGWCFNGFVLVPVNEWKGNMSKPQTIRRIQKKLTDDACNYAGLSTPSSQKDDWDAVGIGLYAKGFFG